VYESSDKNTILFCIAFYKIYTQSERTLIYYKQSRIKQVEVRVYKIFSKIKLFCLIFILSVLVACPAQAQISANVLKVATKTFPPFTFEQNGQYVGFSIDLWKEISEESKIEYELYEESTIVDLLNAVSTGLADVGIAGITITSKREEAVDFSYPFFESGLQILIPSHSSSSFFFLFSLLFSPIVLQTIAFIAVTTLISAHLIWYFECQKNSNMFPREYLLGITEALWWAVVTVVTVGYGDKVPKDLPGRIIASIWMFSGILIISYFTASMSSALTVQQLNTNVNKLTDLTGKQVSTIKGSTAADYLKNRPLGILELDKIEDMFQALKEKKVNAVVYDSPVLLYYANTEGAGKVKVVGSVFQKQSYGIALKRDSPYREVINKALLTIKENGNYDKLYEKWFGKE
jgi:ABC-type amino acid transport substrate-binding protein